MRENIFFFLEWLHSLSMVVSGYTHFPAHDTFSFFYVAVRTLRIPSIDGQQGWFHFLTAVNRAQSIGMCRYLCAVLTCPLW